MLHIPAPLERLDILEVAIPRKQVFHSAIGSRTIKKALLVRWVFPDGQWGIGEAACRTDPLYSGEFNDGACLVLQQHLAPMLTPHGTVGDVVAACRRVRGWPFTMAAVLGALLDGLRRRGVADLIDQHPHRQRRVAVGISLGLPTDLPATLSAIQTAIQRGIQRIKLKINPQIPFETLHAIRQAIPAARLSVDANGCFQAQHVDHLTKLSTLRLDMLEQPFAPGRFDLDQQLKAAAPDLRLCLDESLTDMGAFRTAHAMGVLDVANLKPGRVGGPLASDAIVRWCTRMGIRVWVGGMFETGIGRHANLRLASCLPGSPIHDLMPPTHYLTEDITSPPIAMENGVIDLSMDAPCTVRWDRVEALLCRHIQVQPGRAHA